MNGNDLFGNVYENCGVANASAEPVDASDNYWGTPEGPSPSPADDVCNAAGALTVVAPVRARAVEPKLAAGR